MPPKEDQEELANPTDVSAVQRLAPSTTDAPPPASSVTAADIQPAEQRVVCLGQIVMQVPQMPDAEIGYLENKDRIAVLLGRAPAADVGRHVPDHHVAKFQQMLGRAALRADGVVGG